jgi:hypothetical protein
MSEAPFGKPIQSPQSGVSRANLAPTADAIVGDFRRLILVISETMRVVEESDDEFSKQLCNTKIVAERGLRLSRLLVRMTRAER